MVSRFWHIKSISDACLKINAPDVLFHKHRLRKPMKESIWPRSCTTAGAEWMYLSAPPPPQKKYIYKREGWRNFLMGTHAHMCINTHTHTRIQLHTSTVFCLWNWKCDVTWTMTGVFVKDVAVTSNQWTGASSQGDFPLLRVWLVTPRFSAGWRTVSCQSGIQGVSAEVSSDQGKKKKD